MSIRPRARIWERSRRRSISDGDTTADILFVHLSARVRHHDLSTIRDRASLGQITRKLELLVNTHDGHVALLMQVVAGAANVFDNRGVEALALGRLVDNEQLRRHDERAGDGERPLPAAQTVVVTSA
jgi:hypothetical protein